MGKSVHEVLGSHGLVILWCFFTLWTSIEPCESFSSEGAGG